MKPEQNRLPATGHHRLEGAEIDRRQPLAFWLDGREIHGFAGDTLLTAAIASGVIGAGLHDGEPLALDERFAPPVLLRGDASDRLRALAMERTPAVNGLNFVTLAQARRPSYRQQFEAVRSLLPTRRSRLAIRYDDDVSLAGPWFDAPSAQTFEADLIVVGAGLAGMNAALTAGRRGETVVLVERRQWLGGDARYFGNTGDDEPTEKTIERLTLGLNSLANITILRCAEAFALFEGSVRVHRIVLDAGIPVSRVLTIAAPRIVLASGNIDRLPVFAGNRTPGVVSALAAFNRAERYGVWIGKRALLATANSAAYRVAMQVRDAGVEVLRIADTRLDPQSRFLEYSKAYGIPLARGLRMREAVPAGRHGGLTVRLDHPFGEIERAAEEFAIDQLIVSGGWQPDLALWHMAGGGSRWRSEAGRLEAEGNLPGIELAGSVAGYRNPAACLKSGQAAVAALFGRSAPDIDDMQIDPAHETPDDPTPIGTFDRNTDTPAYLDGGASLAVRPAPARKLRLALGGGRRTHAGFADQARPLSVGDVVAGVQLGIVPAGEAAIVAQERCVAPGDIVDAGRVAPVALPQPAGMAAQPPAYLAGRFGPRPANWVVEADDGRMFEVGCLVYADADETNPLAAIGVVFAPAPAGRSGGLAVIGRAAANAGDRLVVRDISAGVPVRLVDPLSPVEKPILPPPVKVEEIIAAPEQATGPTTAPAPALVPEPPPVATVEAATEFSAASKPARTPAEIGVPATAEAALAMIAGVQLPRPAQTGTGKPASIDGFAGVASAPSSETDGGRANAAGAGDHQAALPSP